MNIKDLNCDLVRALGIDPKDCARLALVVEPDEVPRLQVTRHVRSADGLQTVVEMLRLAPVADEPPVDADGKPEPIVQYLGDVQRLHLSEDDVLVISAAGRLSDEAASRIREYAEHCFPGRRVLVLGDGLKLGVLAKPE